MRTEQTRERESRDTEHLKAIDEPDTRNAHGNHVTSSVVNPIARVHDGREHEAAGSRRGVEPVSLQALPTRGADVTTVVNAGHDVHANESAGCLRHTIGMYCEWDLRTTTYIVTCSSKLVHDTSPCEGDPPFRSEP